MGTPTKKRTRSQRRQRASHFALTARTLTACPKCKREILPHRVCPHCGYYRGRQVLNLTPVPKKPKQT